MRWPIHGGSEEQRAKSEENGEVFHDSNWVGLRETRNKRKAAVTC
jgi:hypothetical protein